MGPAPRVDAPDETVIGGLSITYDTTVLEPRPWTAMQGAWAAELAAEVPPGPILEVCSGAGHIGLVAVSRCDRDLVQVDASRRACALAQANADVAGLQERVQIRCATIEQVRREGVGFPLVIADPPYIASAEIGRFPQDPALAIDGGPDGLDLARACIDLFADVLVPGGVGLLQLGSDAQVREMAARRADVLHLVGWRVAGPTRHVAAVRRA